MDIEANYAGITRRAIAYLIDHFIIKGVFLAFIFFLAKMTFTPFKFTPFISKLLVTTFVSFIYLLPSTILEIFMIRRFGCTPGQFLCFMRIKDANTLKNLTLAQATIRYISFEVIRSSIFITRRFSVKYTSEWWFKPLSVLIIMVIILIFISAVSNRRKQFFHDKIARTVAINYKPSS